MRFFKIANEAGQWSKGGMLATNANPRRFNKIGKTWAKETNLRNSLTHLVRTEQYRARHDGLAEPTPEQVLEGLRVVVFEDEGKPMSAGEFYTKGK